VISAGDYFFPQLLVEFARRHRGISLNFGLYNREELLQELAGNATDLAIMVRPPNDADMVAEPFAPHPYVVVARPDHPLAREKNIPLSRVLREPFIVRERGSDTWHSMEDAFGAHLQANLTDLAIMVRPPVDTDLVAEPFAPHPYVIVAPPDHPLVGKKRIPLARVLREPFIVREKGSDTWHSLTDALGPHLGELNIAMEIKSMETIKQAVIAGMGVSFLSAHTISRELQAGSLAVLDVQRFPLMLNWYVVHRRSKRLPPVAQAFKTFLAKDGAALIEQALGGPALRKRK